MEYNGTMSARTVTVTLIDEDGMSAIPVPFDPKAAFGKVRAPVTVTLNGYTFRSTIALMGGTLFVPFRRSHREAAGLKGGETLAVTFALDTAPRVVTPPADLADALKAAPPAWDRWQAMSFTHQREHVEAIEDARRPETRARRVAAAVRAVAERPARGRGQRRCS
jgi:hypothetical protein